LDIALEDPLQGRKIEPPPPVDVDADEEYQVSSVEDSQVYRNQLQYLVGLTGYDSLTWEPAKFVDGSQAVDEVHE
jgi:hypothetical protein